MSTFQNPQFESALKNIEAMNRLEGFDVVIVCCSSEKQAEYWQQRLTKGKGSILAPNAMVLSVEEDWPGGAGNALGTLYAFSKAANMASRIHNVDLLELLSQKKISVGLYHTAGKGTRLAPLPGSENNNKPGVKLPATVSLRDESSDTRKSPMTILEAVIKQTGCYAKSRMGRLSVFWGDQVFIPTASIEYTPRHHVDILCSLGPMMSESEWKEKGMDKYGLIAQCGGNEAAQVEKVDHATAVKLLSSLGEIQKVGASLGSFSISWQLLAALLKEFAGELSAKKGKLDSDPHLWMPMTLDPTAYQQLMAQKGISEDVSAAHYARIRAMMARFESEYGDAGYGWFFPVDVGQNVYWWDYGQLKLYQRNTLLMTERTPEAEMMRLFFGITPDALVNDSLIVNTEVADSCISSSAIGSESEPKGFVRNSVLSNVRCNYIEAENCLLINVTADRIIMKPWSIAYNVLDDSKPSSPRTPSDRLETATAAGGSPAALLTLSEKDVIVGVFDHSGKQSIVRSHMDTDGGKAWEVKVAGNVKTFEQVYHDNSEACPTTLETVITETHQTVWRSLSGKEKSSH